jgi:hypothetical protein
MLDHLLNYDIESDYECYDCNKKQDVLEESKHWLEGIIQLLYSGEKIDELKLSDHMEELCWQLDVVFPKEELRIYK